MSRMMMDVEIYVEDACLFRALTIEGDLYSDLCTVICLSESQSYEVADKLEAIADGRCHDPYVLDDGPDFLAIKECNRGVRINLNGVCGVLDYQAIREIAHDLRAGWEAVE